MLGPAASEHDHDTAACPQPIRSICACQPLEGAERGTARQRLGGAVPQLRGSMIGARLPGRARLALAAAISVLGLAVISYSYWPGIMIDDARWQYQQAIDNSFEDWHPPLMAWVWRQLSTIEPGPAPMFILQLSLYWAGIALIAGAAYRRGRPWLAVALALAGWVPAPLALTGTITKDCLMAAMLGCSAGLLLWRDLVGTRMARASLSAGALLILVLAAALRFNAFLACLPLALAAVPPSFISTKPRLIATGLAATALFLISGPAVANLLDAEKTDVQLSLIIFDLAGITEHSGVAQFPDMQVARPVEATHRCYDPYQWDSFSSWAKKPCPLNFDRFQAAIEKQNLNPVALWLRSIGSHPLAYAEHRLIHFNLSTWFLVRSGPRFTAWSDSVPNPWNYHVRANAGRKAINGLADWAALTPLGWPIFWLCLSLAAAIIAVSARLQPEIVAIAASPFLYGAGYLVFGVATGMRYYLWTMMGGALAAILVMGSLQDHAPRRARIAGAVLAVPTAMAILARLFL